MFVPPGFSQHSIQTSLGRIVYYTNETQLELPAMTIAVIKKFMPALQSMDRSDT